jgi:putative hydrolase of the HAD superfamily
MRHQRKILLIDADDTLWETNALFERTIAAYVELLAPLDYDPQTIRQEVDRAEHRNIQQRGYGTRSFLLTLEEVYLKLARRGGQAGQRAEDKVLEEIRRLSRILLPVPHRVFDGVAATLTYLKPRHRLFLLTKGNVEEQSAKLAASGLEGFFHGCEIVAEKDASTYNGLVERHGWSRPEVWMVGNSPRSDVNPALAVGLNAVFIPSPVSWDYENEEIRPVSGRLLELERFSDLKKHF